MALREIADVAKIADGRGNLEPFLLLRLSGNKSERGRLGLGDINLETLVATPAHRVGCAELHKFAVVAAKYLSLSLSLTDFARTALVSR